MGYASRLAARVFSYASSHRQDYDHIPRPLLHQSYSTGWNEKKLNGSTMKDRSDDPSHHERTLSPRSYISLPKGWDLRGGGGLFTFSLFQFVHIIQRISTSVPSDQISMNNNFMSLNNYLFFFCSSFVCEFNSSMSGALTRDARELHASYTLGSLYGAWKGRPLRSSEWFRP